MRGIALEKDILMNTVYQINLQKSVSEEEILKKIGKIVLRQNFDIFIFLDIEYVN